MGERREGDSVSPATARKLTRKAAALNATLGDPTRIAVRDEPRHTAAGTTRRGARAALAAKRRSSGGRR